MSYNILNSQVELHISSPYTNLADMDSGSFYGTDLASAYLEYQIQRF